MNVRSQQLVHLRKKKGEKKKQEEKLIVRTVAITWMNAW